MAKVKDNGNGEPKVALTLDEAISDRVKEKKRQETQAKKDEPKLTAEREERIKPIGKLLSDYLAEHEGVKITPGQWQIEELEDTGRYYYTIRFALPQEKNNEEEKEEGEGQVALDVEPAKPEVWVKNVQESSLKAKTFPYRWTARHQGGMIQKYNNFLDAVTFAKEGV